MLPGCWRPRLGAESAVPPPPTAVSASVRLSVPWLVTQFGLVSFRLLLLLLLLLHASFSASSFLCGYKIFPLSPWRCGGGTLKTVSACTVLLVAGPRRSHSLWGGQSHHHTGLTCCDYFFEGGGQFDSDVREKDKMSSLFFIMKHLKFFHWRRQKSWLEERVAIMDKELKQ